MTATATITAVKRTDVLLAPNTALRFTPTATDAGKSSAKGSILSSLIPKGRGGDHGARQSAANNASTATARQVWVLRDGVAVPVALTPGISDGHMTEITDGDLKAGMLVIVDQKTEAK
jgi:HlyD family secretion protein